jgi:hypothetical protein
MNSRNPDDHLAPELMSQSAQKERPGLSGDPEQEYKKQPQPDYVEQHAAWQRAAARLAAQLRRQERVLTGVEGAVSRAESRGDGASDCLIDPAR